MKQAIDKLGAYACKIGKDFSIAFEEMLDFFIETFDTGRVMRHECDYPALLAERKQDNPDMFELLVMWLELTTQGIKKNDDFSKGSAVAYAWIVWEKGYKGNPVVKWLNNSDKK